MTKLLTVSHLHSIFTHLVLLAHASNYITSKLSDPNYLLLNNNQPQLPVPSTKT